MAIIYTPKNQAAITIGGTTSSGPFPSYDITREMVFGGDDVHIGDIYTINISGTIIATGDITTAGARQSDLHGKMISKLQTISTSSNAVGKLEIVPYGGQPNPIEFSDAKLTNISLPSSNDQSSGVQSNEYSLSFQAYEDTSNSGASQFTYRLKSATETWEYTPAETFSYDSDHDITSIKYKTYNVTHTLSAQGANKYAANGSLDTDGAAWRQAQLWVISRYNESLAVESTNTSGSSWTSFDPKLLSAGASDFGIDLSSYIFYNKVRNGSVDKTSGTCNATETFFASKESATHTINVDLSESEDGIVVATVNGSLNGLNSLTSSSNTDDTLTNAETALASVKDYIYTIANSTYITHFGTSQTLRNVPNTLSYATNRTSGTIGYTYTFTDEQQFVSGAKRESITISHSNVDRESAIIAIFPIVGKTDGPVIQNVMSSKEIVRTLSIELTMDRDNRASSPDVSTIITEYTPNVATKYITDSGDSWSPTTGRYSRTVAWTY
jgi:hypothetical protein